MENQFWTIVFSLLAGTAGTMMLIVGWLWNMLWHKISDLELKQVTLSERVGSEYLKSDHFREFEKSLFERLDRILQGYDEKISRLESRLDNRSLNP